MVIRKQLAQCGTAASYRALLMKFCKCYASGRLLASADPGADASNNVLVCQECDAKVSYVRGSLARDAHFRHVSDGGKCTLRSQPPAPQQAGDETCAPEPSRNAWHASWQALGNGQHREAMGIGRDKHRPRDLGDSEANVILEFQHSRISSAEFNERNAGCARATWIFDATGLELYCYGLHDDCFFVRDLWRESYPQSSTCLLYTSPSPRDS